MATEKWVGGSGVGFTWTDATTAASLDSLASGSSVLCTVAIANQSALDLFCDVSIALGSAAFVAPNFVGVYLFPLNKDGSTYGDGRFATAAAGVPGGNYAAGFGSIGLVAATQAQTGTLTRIIMPPGTFKFVLYNGGGVAWVGSGGNTFQYRTYNRAIA